MVTGVCGGDTYILQCFRQSTWQEIFFGFGGEEAKQGRKQETDGFKTD